MENHESDAAVAPINELPLAAEPAVISSSDEEVVEEEEAEEDASSEGVCLFLSRPPACRRPSRVAIPFVPS